ncbi:sulfate transporter family-domain-containing protein [Yarrowia lipolytica]|jgi:sodium-independent sulfate anion transporter 11|uniref:Sulfate transporter family-domain-containing protein n=1 Tax=Yarrowia lipolytica TaxID=4952 RepID=A0A371C306_YARLL|nr:Sulfate permease 2 [Yarrowia lipolytica]RDW24370.1 sulfate transporter family-domain-containing protein [Yarrowia lipolytica]RDW34836.1 sulfate transporter family-domain-containing protein [Yarrowia lipolytica]RDW40865.1 sulfate transporter family-domain-containing protein [Yarrowia lipolytica]RDW44509.1 sulfate transporter family-domain-containing protein [Yarrowia lipolytica]
MSSPSSSREPSEIYPQEGEVDYFSPDSEDHVYLPQYHAHNPRVRDWFYKNVFSHPGERVKNYTLSLFPIVRWIYRYNLVWLTYDLIAGITVGCVVVPQGMSYAKLANLPPEYGLYSSFVGVLIYCFFATSKDVSIGPVAVMSQQVGRVIMHVQGEYPEASGPMIATMLALLCGSIALGIGLLRLGFILEFIPAPAVMGFMTGSAINIVTGQVPALMGIDKLFNTKDATYMVIINSLKNLKHSNYNAAFGVVALFILYLIKYSCQYLSKKFPKYKKVFFYIEIMRSALIIIFGTLISWAVCHPHKKSGKFPISIIKTVPRGLIHTGVMKVDTIYMSKMASELPVSTVVLLLEHIAISKSFGRVNDYKISPDQELIAIGVTNLVGTFFNAYPATGSFSRSALKAKCGVRTPLAGIYTGVVVLIALYALNTVFYWIPNAVLSAIIIHAVFDLVAHPRQLFHFWKIAPIDAVIFFVAIILTVFVTIEAGIYFAVAASLVWLLLKVAFPAGDLMGKIEIVDVEDPLIVQQTADVEEIAAAEAARNTKLGKVKGLISKAGKLIEDGPVVDADVQHGLPLLAPQEVEKSTTAAALSHVPRRTVWVPLSRKNVNPDIKISPPRPGVIVYRFTEAFTYPNCSRQTDKLVDVIREKTRRAEGVRYKTLGERPWNDHGPRHPKESETVDLRPILEKVVLDFSVVSSTDSTGIQNLVDARGEINRYVGREVEFHFSGLLSPWVRRALVGSGFGGVPKGQHLSNYQVTAARRATALDRQTLPNDTTMVIEGDSLSNDSDEEYAKKKPFDEEEAIGGLDTKSVSSSSQDDKEFGGYIPVVSTDTPFFHLDIPDL